MTAAAQVEARHLLEALAELPEEQRRALIGVDFDGLSRAEVAATLDVHPSRPGRLGAGLVRRLRAVTTAVVPYPVAAWAATGPSAGGAAVSALTVKAGAVLLAAGAIGGGIVLRAEHPHPAAAPPAGVVSVSLARQVAPAHTSAPPAPVVIRATVVPHRESRISVAPIRAAVPTTAPSVPGRTDGEATPAPADEAPRAVPADEAPRSVPVPGGRGGDTAPEGETPTSPSDGSGSDEASAASGN